MDTKLTLKLDKDVIQRAKTYAKERKVSLSRLIENHLRAITENTEKSEEKYLPEVNNLVGILKRREGTA
jgi:hypothetical protein